MGDPARLRQVFYIGGFDPRGPAREHRDLREAVAAHPPGPGQEQVTVGPREPLGPHASAWWVDWHESESAGWRTRYHVLRWDDLVRAHWARGTWQSLQDLFAVYGAAARSGVFARIWRSNRPAFWLGMFPLGLWLACSMLWGLLGTLGMLTLGGAPAAWAGPCVLGVVLSARWLSVRLDAAWLLRLYAYFWQYAQGRHSELETRLDAWADTVAEAIARQPARELLFVAHSTGSVLAPLLLARLCRRLPGLGHDGPSLALLTLGHCTPMLAWAGPKGQGLRNDLAQLAAHPGLTWLDVTAPTDWAGFARVPPWLSSEGALARLAQVPPRFHATLGAEAYAALLANRHALHLQYLRAPRFGGGYDPVTWTLGPMTLAERHAALSTPLPLA